MKVLTVREKFVNRDKPRRLILTSCKEELARVNLELSKIKGKNPRRHALRRRAAELTPAYRGELCMQCERCLEFWALNQACEDLGHDNW